MKALLCSWNGCAEQGIMHAFAKIGIDIQSIYYDFAGADYSNECMALLRDTFDRSRFDFVFSQNYIPIISKVCNIYHIKYISWVMDSPAYHLYSNSIHNSCNYIFIFDRMLYEQFHSENPDHIFYYPLATCVTDWELSRTFSHPDRNYTADVSFLGSMYVSEAAYDQVPNLPPELKGYMEGLMDAQLQVYGYNFIEDALDDERAMQFAGIADWNHAEDYRYDVKGVVSQIYLGKKISQMERFKLINAIIDAGLDCKLYTNSKLPLNLQPYNQGTVHYYTEMPFVFRESKINLNITSKSIRSGLPLRMFDIMGCGGFLLTNYQTEIPEYFEIDKDLAVYESIPHAISQIQYYLQHEEERLMIASHGYETVKKHYYYELSLMNILEAVYSPQPDQ